MKIISLLIAGVFSLAMISCSNGSNDQQAAMPADQEQAVPATQPEQAQSMPDSAQATTSQAGQELPEAITSFIKQYFPGTSISYADPDKELGVAEFEVILSNGAKIDFDRNNQWESIESRTQAIPAALIPTEIAKHVKTNYQATPISKIEKKANGYEVELSNRAELKFDNDGQFLRMDTND